MISDHHWEGETPDPSQYFGFVYLIENIDTGRKYIGKKNFFKSTGRSKSRAFDRRSPKWSENHWVEHDWRYYKGSSKDLKKDVKKGSWRFEILSQWHTSRDLHYAEVEAQVERDVLLLVDDNGEYIYYNKAIAAVRFRPPTSHTAETREKMRKSATKSTDEPCPKCGALEWKLIPKKSGGVQRWCKNCGRIRTKEYERKKKTEDPEGFAAKQKAKTLRHRAKDPEGFAAKKRERQRKQRVAKKLTKQGIEWEPATMSPLDVFISQRENERVDS